MSKGNAGDQSRCVALLQIEAAEREEIFKGHLVYLEQRRERELERERERERELERDRELDAEDGAEKKVGSCGLVRSSLLANVWWLEYESGIAKSQAGEEALAGLPC